MKIKIKAGYRSIEYADSNKKETPYVEADIDIDVEFLKYINSRFGEGNTELYDTLCNALMHICSQVSKGVQVF